MQIPDSAAPAATRDTPPVTEKMNSRKFIITLFIAATCTMLVAFGKVAGTVYESVITAVLLIYVGGNVIQRFVERQNDKTP